MSLSTLQDSEGGLFHIVALVKCNAKWYFVNLVITDQGAMALPLTGWTYLGDVEEEEEEEEDEINTD